MTDVDNFVREISDIKTAIEGNDNVGIYTVNTENVKYEIPAILKNFIPKNELSVLRENVKSEEGEYFIKMLNDLSELIKNMPYTYQTEGTPTKEKIAYLHYFYGGSDWYIIEKDKGDKDDKKQGLGVGKQHQAFGYTVLNGDTDMAEWGSISIEELIDSNVELDLYFTPTKFGELFKDAYEDSIETVLDKVENKIELPEISIGLAFVTERGSKYFISELDGTSVSLCQEPEFKEMITPNITSSWNELLNRVNSGKLLVSGFDSYDKFYFAIKEYLNKVESDKKDKKLSDAKTKIIKSVTEKIKPIETVIEQPEIIEPLVEEPKIVTMVREPQTIIEETPIIEEPKPKVDIAKRIKLLEMMANKKEGDEKVKIEKRLKLLKLMAKKNQ